MSSYNVNIRDEGTATNSLLIQTRPLQRKPVMLSETIVLTALYILVIALLYAPKCPAMTATNPAPDYVDYFPEVVEETDTVTDMVIPIAQTETEIGRAHV